MTAGPKRDEEPYLEDDDEDLTDAELEDDGDEDDADYDEEDPLIDPEEIGR